jgi:hypothetical protein
MSSRGLPGFLRRSRRWNEFEDDDNYDNDEVLGNGNEIKDSNEQPQHEEQSNQDQQDHHQQNNEPSLLLSTSLQFLDPSSQAVSSAQEQEHVDIGCIGIATDGIGNGNDAPFHGDDANYDDNNHNNNDNQSLSTIGDFDPTIVYTPPHQLRNASRGISDTIYTSKIGYREAQFEKILSNNVVKLSELRTIGWNGIPVRSVCFFLDGATLDDGENLVLIFVCDPRTASISRHGLENSLGVSSHQCIKTTANPRSKTCRIQRGYKATLQH